MSQAGALSTGGGGGGGTDIRTITGNSGGAVPPNAAHNINIVGTGTLTVVGSPGTNTLTITDSNTVWSRVSVNTTMAINNGYICVSPGGNLEMLLPAVSPVGSVLEITLAGATSFIIKQIPLSPQSVNFGSTATTVSGGGSIQTVDASGSSIRMVCILANTTWQVLSSVGNFLIV